jgi:hypothetical protein
MDKQCTVGHTSVQGFTVLAWPMAQTGSCRPVGGSPVATVRHNWWRKHEYGERKALGMVREAESHRVGVATAVPLSGGGVHRRWRGSDGQQR